MNDISQILSEIETGDPKGAYLEKHYWHDAEGMLRSCLGLREKQGSADWRRYLTMSQLGAALAAQREYAEAEPLLVDGYQGMELHKSESPAHRKKVLTAAASRILPFYEVWGKADKVAIWRGNKSARATASRTRP